ncbi:MAG: TrmB family transcriptional regulator [Haloglomus sp.]
MDTEALVETLQDASLSPYQANAYVALLELGAASASKVAEAGDVPQPRIYDVLEALEAKGFVETYETDAIRARAHSPEEALSALRDRADRFDAAAEEVEQRWEQPELESNQASIVSRFETVLDRAESFIEEAEYQIQLSVTPDDFEQLRPSLVDAHDRGVSTRVCIHTGPDEEPPSSDRLAGACLEARHRRIPAPFVALVDRERTCFCHHPDAFEQYGVLVSDRTYTYVFHWYFLTCLWEHWDTIYDDFDNSYPVTYVDIRQCVRDLRPLVEAGAEIRVTVEGHQLSNGQEVSVRGTVDDAVFTGDLESPDAVERLSGQVALVLDTDDGTTVSIGGWGAVMEDVEATRITVEEVLSPGDARSEAFGRS